jgi:hypothetical protein
VEVWNEPNTPSFWRGSPQQYVELVHAAAEGVRTSPYADVPVVGGAVSGSDLAYLGVLFDAGIAQWTDAISVHPYDVRFGAEGYSDPSLARDGDIWSYAFGVPHVHDLMVARGDTDPLWITEFGYPNCPGTPHCVTPELQADYLAKAAELAESWPYVDLFMVYRLRDWVPEDGTMEAHFGVLNQDYSQKPAAQALAPIFKKWKTPAP